jgi:tetratricopeptide (TPR) repeat protein
MRQGRLFYEAGQLDNAIQEFKAALAIDPDSGDAHFFLGKAYFSSYLQSHRAAGSKYMNDLIASQRGGTGDNPTEEELLRIYEAYGLRSDYETLATQEFTLAARLNPDNWMAHYHVAVDHLNHHRYEDAIKEYELALKANPEHEISHAGLGSAYYKLSQFDLAIVHFKKAISLSHRMSYTDFQLALAYLKTGQRTSAIAILQQFKNEDRILYDSLYCQIYGQTENGVLRCTN